jgi:hypothetical protein
MPRRKMTEEEKAIAKKKREHKKLVNQLRSTMNGERKRLEKANMPTPPKNRLFEIGDRVEIGNLDDNVILEVCNDGKFYKVLTINEIIKYGQHKGYSFKIWYTPWNNCLPYRKVEDIIEIDSLIENDDIRFSYSQRMLDSLISTYYSGAGLDLNPSYQRGNVWTEDQKVALIDSIFKNIDIGKRRPFREERQHYYEMLDGKQRLTAVLDFIEEKFRYKGKLFSELHRRDQNHLENYSISYAETEPLTEKQKYRYFIKLNTTGTPMDKMHLANVKSKLDIL